MRNVVLTAPLLAFGDIGTNEFLNARIALIFSARLNQGECIVDILNLLLPKTAIIFLEFGSKIIGYGSGKKMRYFAAGRCIHHHFKSVVQKGEEVVRGGGDKMDADHILFRVGVATRVRFRDINALIKRGEEV